MATYATVDIIPGELNDITNCRETPNETPVLYKLTFWDNSLCCCTVYDEATLEGVIIEGLPEPIRLSRHHHWAWDKSSLLKELAGNSNSVHTL